MRISLDRFGGAGQQDGQPVGGHPGPQPDQAADVPQPQPDRGFGRREPLGPVDQGLHAGGIRAVPGGVGRRGQAAGPVRVGRAELGGAFQRGGGRGVSAAPQRPVRRPLELGGGPLVGAGGGPGQVPGPAVVLLPVGQGGVRGSPLGRAGLVIDRRTDERVREHHGRGLDRDQAVEAVEPGRVDAESGGRRGDRGQPPGTGAQQGQRARARVQLADPRREHALELPGQRERLGQRLGPGELGRTQRARQLDERERMARGGREQRVPDGRGQRAAPFGQQGAGLAGSEAADDPLGQSGLDEAVNRVRSGPMIAGIRGGPGGGQHDDGFVPDPADDEGQDAGGRPVQPLHVVDQAEHGPARVRQQREHGQRDQERVRGVRGGLQAERDPQGRRLRSGQAVHAGQQRAEQLVHRRVGQARLGRRPGGRQHAGAAGPLARVPEQGGLADPRLAAEQQAAALAGLRPAEHRVDRGRLRSP